MNDNYRQIDFFIINNIPVYVLVLKNKKSIDDYYNDVGF